MFDFESGNVVRRIRDELPGTLVRLEEEAEPTEYSFGDELKDNETVWVATVLEDSPVYPHHPEGKELIVREDNLDRIDPRILEDDDF